MKDYLQRDERFRYQLLDRCRTDCLYFLDKNGGNFHSKYLWALDAKEHIQVMKDLWNSFSVKPEWLSWDEICEFEKQMLCSNK